MQNLTAAPYTSAGCELDAAPDAFGSLQPSDAGSESIDTLRERLGRDGYLYLRGFYPREKILAGRRRIIAELDSRSLIDRDHPLDDAVIASKDGPGARATIESLSFLGQESELRQVLYENPLRGFLDELFEGPTRSFDFTWIRAVARNGARPHCDIVYMGRGTDQLHTTWTPWGDIGRDLGGLMVLEGSHRQSQRLRNYLSRDVDSYCENLSQPAYNESHRLGWNWDGALTKNPATLRDKLGGRWLTTDFAAGDIMLFGMGLVHGSLDNRTERFRISSDTRHQRADLAVDPRWIGEKPMGHARAAKQGRIC